MESVNRQLSSIKRHKKLALVVLGIILLIALVPSGGEKQQPESSSRAGTEVKQVQTAKKGDKVRDGKFEFEVSSYKCGDASVTDSSGYLTETAQGRYCTVGLTVSNIGDAAQRLFSSDQTLIMGETKHSADDTATSYANEEFSFSEEINPGNTVSLKVVFDVPKNVTPNIIELHDSSFSGGVKVSLD